MKLNSSLAKSLLMAASIGMVVPIHTRAQGDADNPPDKTAGTEPETLLPSDAVPGLTLERKNGGYVALAIESGNFVLRFMDEKKQKVAPDAVRAASRWKAKGRLNEDRGILLPGVKADALVGNRFVQPPFIFDVYVTLIGEDDKAIESLIFKFGE